MNTPMRPEALELAVDRSWSTPDAVAPTTAPSGAALDALREQNADARTWVVWSFEHDCWWAGNHSGYTSSLLSAGLYTEAEAKEIARPRRKGRPDEEARPLAVALADEATKWHGPKVVEHVLALLTEHTALREERDAGRALRSETELPAHVLEHAPGIAKAPTNYPAWLIRETVAALLASHAALSTRLAVAGVEQQQLQGWTKNDQPQEPHTRGTVR